MERNHKGGHRQSLRQTVRPCTPAPFSCCCSLKRQQGVTSILFVFLLATVILVFMALAVDSARLYNAHSKLQNQANAAAIAAANAAYTCSSAGDERRSVEDYVEAALPKRESNDVDIKTAELGYLNSSNRSGLLTFSPKVLTSDFNQSNAAHVVLEQKNVPLSMFLPGELTGTVNLRAQATAEKQLIASISASGSTAVLGGTEGRNVINSLLGAVLNEDGAPFSLDATQFKSLAGATVKLGDLLDGLGVDNLTDVIGGGATADVLNNAIKNLNSQQLAPIVGLLDKVVRMAGINGLSLSDVLQPLSNQKIPQSAEIPVYDLTIGLVLDIAKKLAFVPLNLGVTLGIPGLVSLGDINVNLVVGAPPVMAIGPAIRSSGQWVTRFKAADVNLVLSVGLGLKLLGLSLYKISLPLTVETGGGEGYLEAASCARGVSNKVRVRLYAKGSTASIQVKGVDADGNALDSIKVSLLNGLIPIAEVYPLNNSPVTLLSVNSSGMKAVYFDGTPPGSDVKNPVFDLYRSKRISCFSGNPSVVKCFPYKSKNIGGGLSADDPVVLGSNNMGVKVLGFIPVPLKSVLDPVNKVLESLGSAILGPVVNPLLSVLGIQVGNLSVTITGLSQPPVRLVPGDIVITNE